MSPLASSGPVLRAGPIGGWQVLLVGGVAVASWCLGRGSIASVAAGALLLHASMRSTEVAFRWSVGGGRKPVLAVALFLGKLGLLIGIAVLGLATRWIAPMSLAVGAASLPLAIVLDTCYLAWANPRGARRAEHSAETPRTTKRWNIL